MKSLFKKKKKATGKAVCQNATAYSRYLAHLEGSHSSELRFFSLLQEEFLDFMAAVLERYSSLPTQRQFGESVYGIHWNPQQSPFEVINKIIICTVLK